MHRFFVTPESIRGRKIAFAEVQARQILQVLRLRPGAHVVVLDNSGNEYEVRLTKVARAGVEGQAEEVRLSLGEPRVRLTLYQSLLPREKFEWVLQKGTEIGVSSFVPVIAQRSLARDAASVTPAKVARWERIITEAAEQSRRGRLPEVQLPISFSEAVETVAADCALIPWEKAEQNGIGAALGQLPREKPAVALFIGPEGGFDEAELEIARSGGVIPTTLGRRILRAETAAAVAAAFVLYELGEMG
jgi:16S rRNA (uracil1498-N3)-methyltransferase